MQASEQTFSKIIQSDNGNEHYHIPKYQRSYSWRRTNWEELFDDIYDNEIGHFIGSIICIDASKGHSPGHEIIYEVIDGQQRLTTITLLLAAVFKKMNSAIKIAEQDGSLGIDFIDDLKGKCRGIRLQLIKRIKPEYSSQNGVIQTPNIKFILRVNPASQNNNLDDYLFIMSDCGALSYKFECPSHFGNRLMAKAYRYFQKVIPDELGVLETLQEKINQLQLVHISVDSHANAFRLFETLNNRGTPLTAIDIIKNKMLSELKDQLDVDVDDAYEQWQYMLEDIESVEDRFLRQFYNAFKHKGKIGQKSFPHKATSSTLISIYEGMIKDDPQYVLTQLIEKAKSYADILQPDESTRLGKSLIDLGRIGAGPSNTLILYLMDLSMQQFENENTLYEIVEFLKKYNLRRNITDTPPTRDLDQIQINVIKACEENFLKGDLLTTEFLISKHSEGIAAPASLEVFKNSLLDNLYFENINATRYVLVKLCESQHNREFMPDFWARSSKGKYIWTIEHVFPQGKNIPIHWVEMIADGDVDLAKEIQEDVVHCLGNLTLSGYNSTLSNQSFVRKQSKTEITAAGQKMDIGYKNGLYLNELLFNVGDSENSLSKADVWTKDYIESRNVRMVELVCDQFRFVGEPL